MAERKVVRVLVCGGRRYADREHVYHELDLVWAILLEAGHDMLVIQGGATGADQLARDWCLNNGVHCATIEALWHHYDKAAGPLRNGVMASLRPHFALAFPGGTGTADMVAKLKAAGVKGKMCGARRGSTRVAG